MNPPPQPPDRLETLYVLRVGLRVEMLDQHQLWTALDEAGPGSVLPAGSHFYPEDIALRQLAWTRRAAQALAEALGNFVEDWAVPCIAAWPAAGEAQDFFAGRLDVLQQAAGLPAHSIVRVEDVFSDEPDDLLERAFRFMDAHPAVPAVLLFAADGDVTRLFARDDRRSAFWGNGPRPFGSLCETAVALLVGRPERLQRLAVDALSADKSPRLLGASSFEPSRFVPHPWRIEQLRRYHAVPPLAELHRPVRLGDSRDADGRPATPASMPQEPPTPAERTARFEDGLARASAAAADIRMGRIVYDAGGPETGARLVPLSQALGAIHPRLDLFDPARGHDVHARLGDTGAAGPLVQWSLAALSTADHLDAALAIHLRRGNEATFVLSTPATGFATNPYAAAPATAMASPARQVEPVRVAVGTRVPSGTRCPQGGMWFCDQSNAEGGALHFIPAGHPMPFVTVAAKISTWQKLRGESGRTEKPTVWTLLSHDAPVASAT